MSSNTEQESSQQLLEKKRTAKCKRRKRKMRVARDHARVNHTDNLFEKKGGVGGNSKGNHSSAEENGKLPLSLTGKHSTQAEQTL